MSLANQNVSYLKYQIREIVDVAKQIEKLDPTMTLTWENIGDPIKKGWTVPSFLKEILADEINRRGDRAFAYSHSRGLPETREWVCRFVKKHCPSSMLELDDVLFTSGLGSAIASIYQMLPDGARILQPAPTYPTHASFESFRHASDPLFYSLDHTRGWQPDIRSIEKQLETRSDIAGIVIINPNNPTGAVYDRTVLEEIVVLAESHGLMIISDEIYFQLVFNGKEHHHMVDVAQGRVPLIVLRGISKDVPWPGGRCGWVEFHNTGLDAGYAAYAQAVKKRVLMEVCATTMPQMVLPRIYDHPDYIAWVSSYCDALDAGSEEIAMLLQKSSALQVQKTKGAFYMMPTFVPGVLNTRQTLPIKNDEVRAYIEKHVQDPTMTPDKRFAYYLLGATGICVVPATGFFSDTPGFRITTLERDEIKRHTTYTRIVSAIEQYV